MEEGYERLKAESAFLCVDCGMVDSSNLGLLQTAFDTLTRLFDRVGLWTNIRRTVGMVCQP